MPTGWRPGGRTLVGGDMMPRDMPWPKRTPAKSRNPIEALTRCLQKAITTRYTGAHRGIERLNPTLAAVTIEFVNCLLRTATFLLLLFLPFCRWANRRADVND